MATTITPVTYKPGRCSPPRGPSSQLLFDNITLQAGPRNYLSDDDLSRLMDHPDFARYEAIGAIEIQGAAEAVPTTPGNEYPANLSTLKTEAAEDLINATDDLEVLRTWFDAETRKGVREILSRRMREITSATSN